jgi:hypothetical protein
VLCGSCRFCPPFLSVLPVLPDLPRSAEPFLIILFNAVTLHLPLRCVTACSLLFYDFLPPVSAQPIPVCSVQKHEEAGPALVRPRGHPTSFTLASLRGLV